MKKLSIVLVGLMVSVSGFASDRETIIKALTLALENTNLKCEKIINLYATDYSHYYEAMHKDFLRSFIDDAFAMAITDDDSMTSITFTSNENEYKFNLTSNLREVESLEFENFDEITIEELHGTIVEPVILETKKRSKNHIMYCSVETEYDEDGL